MNIYHSKESTSVFPSTEVSSSDIFCLCLMGSENEVPLRSHIERESFDCRSRSSRSLAFIWSVIFALEDFKFLFLSGLKHITRLVEEEAVLPSLPI